MDYFDYKTEAAEAGLAREDLKALCRLVRQEFPTDKMICGLPVLRACTATKDGYWSLDEMRREGSALASSAGE